VLKAYVITTGTIYALIVVAHIWRVAVEGTALLEERHFILLTVAAAGLSLWSFWLLRGIPKR
jgi:hypothetical protein